MIAEADLVADVRVRRAKPILSRRTRHTPGPALHVAFQHLDAVEAPERVGAKLDPRLDRISGKALIGSPCGPDE